MTESIKWNAVICAGFVMLAYFTYGMGSYITTGIWPDGNLFAGVIGTILLIFGVRGGQLIERRKQNNG